MSGAWTFLIMGSQPAEAQVTSSPDPTSFYGALQKKYSNSSVKVSSGFQVFLPQVKHGKTDNGGWNIPKFLNLDCGVISSAGNVSELEGYCFNVIELNLAQNVLTSWREVFTILDCMPSVEFLNLSQNPLLPILPDASADTLSSDSKQHGGRRYPNMKRLVLNATCLPLTTVSHLIESAFPNLQELYLSKNDYTCLDGFMSGAVYPSLSLLQLSSNNISSWHDVTKLGRRFVALLTLVLANNPIRLDTIVNEALGDLPAAFPSFSKLSSLNLSNSAIGEWCELDALSVMPCLVDVRLMGIPLTEGMDDKLRRQLLVASFPARLARLNGSQITSEERENAERTYLRHFASAAASAVKLPQRYQELEKQHGGVPQPLANVDLAPPTKATVTVVHGEKRELITVKLRQSVGDLKKLLQTFAGMSATKFDLYIQDPETPHGSDKLLYMNKQLFSLNVRDGYEFHVQPKRS